MYYSITSSCIREIKSGDAPATFGGSSSYQSNSPSEISKKPPRRPTTAQRHPPVASHALTHGGAADILGCPSNREYRLNKSKIRRKMSAFFHLQATREFCAFYTITFPCGVTDDDAYTLFNLWQTRCRKAYGLKSFIWVAERQKNGTVHFHLLTNTRMPIRQVVGFMRTALLPYAHRYGWDVPKINKYNGIDVDNVWYPKRRPSSANHHRRTRDDAARHLGKYITKYVSKNNTTFNRLAWHESRDISALFTSQNFDVCEVTPLLSYFTSTRHDWKCFPDKYYNVYCHPSVYDLNQWLDLKRLNEVVYAHIA